MLDPPLELQMHDKLVLAAKELHQELHEDVENVGLVDIANHVAKKGPLGVENGEQGCALVDLGQQEQQVSVRAFIEQIVATYRNHGKNADDLQLNGRLGVIAQVLHYLIASNCAGKHCANHAKDVCVGG